MEKKITDHNHDNNITTPEFNKLTSENFAARLKQASLVNKTEFDNKLRSFSKRVSSNKTKHLEVEKKQITEQINYASKIVNVYIVYDLDNWSKNLLRTFCLE